MADAREVNPLVLVFVKGRVNLYHRGGVKVYHSG
jgi:hypothetical protein